MPRYVYQAIEDGCVYCKEGFEANHSAQIESVQACPRCQTRVSRKIFPVSTLTRSRSSDAHEPISHKPSEEHFCSSHCNHNKKLKV